MFAAEIVIGLILVVMAIIFRAIMPEPRQQRRQRYRRNNWQRFQPSRFQRRWTRRRPLNVPIESGTYQVRQSIATKGELAFLPALRIAVGQQYQVMCSVRIADIVDVDRTHRYYKHLFGRVAQKHVDFVLCEPTTLRPVVMVELDDPTHRFLHRSTRDKFVDEVASSAGIPILHVLTAQAYDPIDIRDRIGRLTRVPQSRR